MNILEKLAFLFEKTRSQTPLRVKCTLFNTSFICTFFVWLCLSHFACIAVSLFSSLSTRARARFKSLDVVPEVIIYISVPRKHYTDTHTQPNNTRHAAGRQAD